MSEGSRWSSADLERVRALARQRLAENPLPKPESKPRVETPQPAFGPATKAAAVVSRFRVDALAVDPTESESLHRASVGLEERGAAGWRSLLPEVRSAVLGQLQQGELQQLLDSNAQAGDPLQTGLRKALEGIRPAELLGLEAGPLAALVQVYDGLVSQVPALPPRQAMERKLELVRLLEPLRKLTRNFSGREVELQKLRDYVGVLPPGSLLGAAKRFVASVFFSQRQPPFLVTGLGGLGKTTLVAQFILEHALIGQDLQFPFAYLDFDRPTVMAQEPATILVEAVRQIGLQYETGEEAGERLRLRWQQRLRSTGPTDGPLAEHFVQDFASFLNTLQLSDGPVLLVLDTFEEVQRRSATYARGVVALVNLLSDRIPRLRVVIAGRGEIPGVDVAGSVALTAFDPPAAIGYLKSKGVDPPTAEAMVKQVGGSPLALSLALSLFQRDPAQVRTNGLGVDGVQLRERVAEAQLLDRFLLHIGDEDVRRLAHPGLALRRVTSKLIREVLAGPCNVAVADDQRADQLFAKLAAEVTLFYATDNDQVLVYKPDLRRLVLPSVYQTAQRKVEEIHRLAVGYYARQKGDLASRAEEVYHRLALGQSQQEIGPITRDLEPYLASAMDELAPPEQALLSGFLGLELSPEASLAADQETWERVASRRVRELMQTGDLPTAESVLQERSKRSAATDLRVIEATLLDKLGKVEEARVVADAGIEAYRQAGNVSALFSLLLVAAFIAGRSDFDAAPRYLDEAEEIARRRDDPFVLMHALRARCAHDRRFMPPGIGPEAGSHRRQELASLAARTSDGDWGQDLSLLRQVATELGDDDHGLVARAIRLGAIDLSSSQLEAAVRQSTGTQEGPRKLEEILVGETTPQVIEAVFAMLRQEEPGEPRVRKTPSSRSRRRRLKLEDSQRHQLSDLIADEIGPGLGSFLEARLDRSLESLSFAGPGRQQALDVLAAAEREDWLPDLVVALGRSRSGNPAVLGLLDSLGMGPKVEEASSRGTLAIKTLRAMFAEHRAELGALEARTCTIEAGNEVRGCGFLVGPRSVLTASDVVTLAPSLRDLRFRFDRVALAGETVAEGEVHTPARQNPIVVQQQTYCIVRLDEDIGSRPVDARRADPKAPPRGFVAWTLERRLGSGALLWLWREHRGTFFTGIAAKPEPAAPPGLLVDVRAQQLTRGAPCVDSNFDVVALFCGPVDRNRARIVPVEDIAVDLPS